jgi:hypothetical protein
MYSDTSLLEPSPSEKLGNMSLESLRDVVDECIVMEDDSIDSLMDREITSGENVQNRNVSNEQSNRPSVHKSEPATNREIGEIAGKDSGCGNEGEDTVEPVESLTRNG